MREREKRRERESERKGKRKRERESERAKEWKGESDGEKRVCERFKSCFLALAYRQAWCFADGLGYFGSYQEIACIR